MRKWLVALMLIASGAMANTVVITPGDYMSDLLARTLMPSAVVLARPGADGVVAYNALKLGEGQFAIATTTTYMVAPALNDGYAADPATDFRVVTIIARTALVLAARTGRFHSLSDALSANRAISVGGFGAVSACSMVAALLRDRGHDITYVPYRSTAQLAADVSGGHVDVACGTADVLDTFVAEGRWTALASLGTESHGLPRIQGFPTMDIEFFLLAKHGESGASLLNEMRGRKDKFNAPRFSVLLTSPEESRGIVQRQRIWWQELGRKRSTTGRAEAWAKNE